MILLINACVRGESRTLRLTKHLLQYLEDPVREVRLAETVFPQADAEFLKLRNKYIEEQNYDVPMFEYARDFAAADTIVVAAPYWDLSFPASLKQYFEQINVIGLTFHYPDGNIPQGLCRARKLYYVTTAGGTGHPDDFGYGYVKALAEYFYGIPETHLIRAEGLDLVGADPEVILSEAENKIDELMITP